MRGKRSQRRLNVEMPIQVISCESDRPITVHDQDLSWGGVKFIASDPLIREGSCLKLIFPWVNGQSFNAEAKVVRREMLPNGCDRFAARFTSLCQRSERRLEKLLEILAEHDQEAASDGSMPTMERLEIIFGDEDEMHEKLAQIADGKLSVIVFGAYEVDQTILLMIGSTRDFPGLRLRARVHAQTTQQSKSCEWASLVRLDLRFEHPLEELEQFVNLLQV